MKCQTLQYIASPGSVTRIRNKSDTYETKTLYASFLLLYISGAVTAQPCSSLTATAVRFESKRDSCGGIQTRSITILNYDWSITHYSVIRTNCNSAEGFIGLRDSFGKTNTADSVFNGFTYVIVTPDGDAILSSDNSFRISLEAKLVYLRPYATTEMDQGYY